MRPNGGSDVEPPLQKRSHVLSIFGAIKSAIFGHPAVQAAPTAAPQTTQAAPTPAPTPAAAPAAAAPQEIDADAALAKIAHSKGDPDLNYKTSIVDLMKLIGMDSSLANRQQLATELGYTGDKNGSAEMNLWLHDKVMERIRTGK
jgi:3-oxoacyl-ACP reductase-like protein